MAIRLHVLKDHDKYFARAMTDRRHEITREEIEANTRSDALRGIQFSGVVKPLLQQGHSQEDSHDAYLKRECQNWLCLDVLFKDHSRLFHSDKGGLKELQSQILSKLLLKRGKFEVSEEGLQKIKLQREKVIKLRQQRTDCANKVPQQQPGFKDAVAKLTRNIDNAEKSISTLEKKHKVLVPPPKTMLLEHAREWGEEVPFTKDELASPMEQIIRAIYGLPGGDPRWPEDNPYRIKHDSKTFLEALKVLVVDVERYNIVRHKVASNRSKLPDLFKLSQAHPLLWQTEKCFLLAVVDFLMGRKENAYVEVRTIYTEMLKVSKGLAVATSPIPSTPELTAVLENLFVSFYHLVKHNTGGFAEDRAKTRKGDGGRCDVTTDVTHEGGITVRGGDRTYKVHNILTCTQGEMFVPNVTFRLKRVAEKINRQKEVWSATYYFTVYISHQEDKDQRDICIVLQSGKVVERVDRPELSEQSGQASDNKLPCIQSVLLTHAALQLVPFLVAIHDDTAGVLSQVGKSVGFCCYCDSPLTDAKSKEQGFGPTCAKTHSYVGQRKPYIADTPSDWSGAASDSQTGKRKRVDNDDDADVDVTITFLVDEEKGPVVIHPPQGFVNHSDLLQACSEVDMPDQYNYTDCVKATLLLMELYRQWVQKEKQKQQKTENAMVRLLGDKEEHRHLMERLIWKELPSMAIICCLLELTQFFQITGEFLLGLQRVMSDYLSVMVV